MKRMFDDHGIVGIEVEFLGDWFETGEKKAASNVSVRTCLKRLTSFAPAISNALAKCGTNQCVVSKMVGRLRKRLRRRAGGRRNNRNGDPADDNVRTLETARASSNARTKPMAASASTSGTWCAAASTSRRSKRCLQP